MTYYITKDCGDGWDETMKAENLPFWELSKRQEGLARKVAAGDVLLHYIDHVHAWAGYSEVTGRLEANTRGKNPDWCKALPFLLPIKSRVYLKKQQCTLTRNLAGVSDRHRQPAFSRVPDEEAGVIIKAIKDAKDAKLSGDKVDDPAFIAAWKKGADGYYGDIRKAQAGYKCEACGADGITWAEKYLGGRLRKGDKESPPDWFLEAAHITARCKEGLAIPDNLRALCRNCHHLIDRLPDEERVKYLGSLSRKG